MTWHIYRCIQDLEATVYKADQVLPRQSGLLWASQLRIALWASSAMLGWVQVASRKLTSPTCVQGLRATVHKADKVLPRQSGLLWASQLGRRHHCHV